ncbi:hypothetical protein Ahia01_001300700, partial [Argonauta hians]
MADDSLHIKTHLILDDYIIYWQQKLGNGLSGPVRLCRKKSTEEMFAVKCLSDCPRTRTEVKLHTLCSNHPHIVTVHDVYANSVKLLGDSIAKPCLLMVMELMEGGELFHRILKERGFTEKLATSYLRQIASAIERCHSQNVAHRDLKPENLLLKDNSSDALVKLTDFGFATVDNGHLTASYCTPYYVAPEVLKAGLYKRQGRKHIIQTSEPCVYDKSCDMWSLGVIYYIMLCGGCPPFYSESETSQLSGAMQRNILAGQFKQFPESSLISHSAKDIIRRLLHVDPTQRMTIGQLTRCLGLHGNNAAAAAAAAGHQSPRLPPTQRCATKLKPVKDVCNPMLQKRQLRLTSSGEGVRVERATCDPTTTITTTTTTTTNSNNTENAKVKAIRDIIASCILPSSVGRGGREDEKTLTNLTIRASRLNRNDVALMDILRRWGWDGEKFNVKVDHKLLARYLSGLLLHRSQLASARRNLSLPLTTTTTNTFDTSSDNSATTTTTTTTNTSTTPNTTT